MKTKITAHMIVKNEEQWVWFALTSALSVVDHFEIYDTGSTDKTIKIVEYFSQHMPASKTLRLSQKGEASAARLTNLRNEQLQNTKSDWFLILDGDEVWTNEALKEATYQIRRKNNFLALVSKSINPVGDLFHIQSEEAGKYVIAGKTGHFNIRWYKKVSGYQWSGIYPLEAYVDKNGQSVQKKTAQLLFLKNPYWHLTHLQRSTVDVHQKRKFEVGNLHPYKLPEVFFLTRPKIVPSPWISFSSIEKIKARALTPAVRLKRSIGL